MKNALIFGLVLTAVAQAQGPQPPVPEAPRVYIETTYQQPSGSTIRVRSGDDLQAAFDRAKPGDTVVLEAGATFTGNFDLLPKKGKGWIYIQSSAVDQIAHSDQRTSPADASKMPKIQTSNSTSAITAQPGATNYRLVGLEITPAKGAPRVYQLVNIDFITSRVEAKLRDMVKGAAPSLVGEADFPQNITIDRCYIHGSDTQDVRQGVVANGTSIAVINSYISDIHDSTQDSQGILAYRTSGPIKIVNNFISSTTENVMFGGAGGANNPYVPADVEIRGNWLYKPLSWIPLTTGGNGKWSVKNNLEFKSMKRAIVSGNVLENDWPSAQNGTSLLLTPRVANDQGGPDTVVDDIDIESNILKNVNAGFAIAEFDEGVKDGTWKGETRRVRIANNLILLRDNGSGFRPGFSIGPTLQDVIIEHNTQQTMGGTPCYGSFYFNAIQTWRWPPAQSYAQDLWVLDNVLCRQPSGDNGAQGTEGLVYYMGDPRPLDPRFLGNVIYVPAGDTPHPFPRKNTLPTKIAYADPATGNYQLTSPKWTQTSDGKMAGVDMVALQTATADAVTGNSSGKQDALPTGTAVH